MQASALRTLEGELCLEKELAEAPCRGKTAGQDALVWCGRPSDAEGRGAAS